MIRKTMIIVLVTLALETLAVALLTRNTSVPTFRTPSYLDLVSLDGWVGGTPRGPETYPRDRVTQYGFANARFWLRRVSLLDQPLAAKQCDLIVYRARTWSGSAVMQSDAPSYPLAVPDTVLGEGAACDTPNWGSGSLTARAASRTTVRRYPCATSLDISLWAVTVAFAIYPALAFMRAALRWWRRRRRRANQCVRCGYNLTGLSEPRCPECGEAI